MIIVGSYAMKLRGFEKKPLDIDLIMSFSEWETFHENYNHLIKLSVPTNNKIQVFMNDGSTKLEIEIGEFQESSSWLLDNANLVTNTMNVELPVFGTVVVDVPSIEILFLIKKSHVHCHSIHFDKTMKDYHILKSVVNSESLSMFDDFFEIRKSEAEIRSKHRTPSLNVSNDEFFDRSKDKVGYVFVHDTIHEAVKHYDRPIYEYLKRDYEKAHCERDLFDILPHQMKIQCVQEESYVIAIERYLLMEQGATPYESYHKSLMRICTTLCSGYFREFAINNYYDVLSAYDPTYPSRFLDYDGLEIMHGVDESRKNEVMEIFNHNYSR